MHASAHGATTRSPKSSFRRCARSLVVMSSRRADPCILVIFGASGDLTRRKLLPAVYNLAETNHLPEPFAILGVARPQLEQTAFRTSMREHVTDAEGETLD